MAYKDPKKKKERHTQWMRKFVEQNVARGICDRCGKKPAEDGRKCLECRQKQQAYQNSNKEERAAYMREWKRSKVAQGICERCGTKPAVLAQKCLECREKTIRLRQENRRQKRLANQCDCGKPLFTKCACVDCYEKHKVAMADRKKRLKEAGVCIACAKNPASGSSPECVFCLLKRLSHRLWKTNNRWQELKDLYDRQGGKCVYTGRKITIGDDADIDHIIPVSAGGSNDLGNLQWVCHHANMAKWNFSEAEFLQFVADIAAHRHLYGGTSTQD